MLRRAPILLALVLLAACAGKGGSPTKLNETLYAYQSTIRWGDLTGALAFVAPDERDKQAPTALEERRLAQLQVAGYYVQGSQQLAEGEYEQIVEIRVVNRNTQVERSVIDRQTWRWNVDDRAWYLTSGLPEFSQQ
jgi:hypothetical protein